MKERGGYIKIEQRQQGKHETWKEFQEQTAQNGFGEVNSHAWQELKLCSMEA